MKKTIYQNWNEGRTALLRKHHADGVSASVSAEIINKETGSTFTRSAIMGKRHRLGLTESADSQ